MDWIAPSLMVLLAGLFLRWQWRGEPQMRPLPLAWSLVVETVLIALASFPSVAMLALTFMGEGHAIARGAPPRPWWWPYFIASFPVILALGLSLLFASRRHWPLLAAFAILLVPLRHEAVLRMFARGG